MILCSNPHAQYLTYKNEIDAAISRVLDKGHYILGEEVGMLEEEFAEYNGVSYGIGVGSGTEALHLALAACGIGHGDEVVTVSHTAVATVSAITLAGAIPVLVDIEPDFYTIDPQKIESAITPNTKALIPVHMYGQPADMDPILDIAQRKGLYVIEDCAQAHGAKYDNKRVGSLGDMGCFSFYPTKNLGAIGDGGMVVTNNIGLAEKAKLFREYGWVERYISHFPGWNTRLDEIQAAILRIKLKKLDKDNARRRRLAEVYNEDLSNTSLTLPKTRKNVTHVYHLYVIRSRRRNELLTFLREKNIYASIHYPAPVHLQPAYNHLTGMNTLSITEHIAQEILSLPIYPELSDTELMTVIDAIKEFEGQVI